MKREPATSVLVFCLLVLVGVASRWISDAWQPALSNVTATAAAGLFAGFFFSRHIAACLVPLAIVVLSNLGLPKYNNSWEMSVALVMLLLPVALGCLLQRKSNWLRIFGFAATPAILFYLVTDIVIWPGFNLYPHTFAGQIDSYIAALPFLGKMLAGDLLYTGLIFGTYWLTVASGEHRSDDSQLIPVPVAKK